MAPSALPAGFDQPWEPSSGYVLVDPGLYDASIFEAELKTGDKGDFWKLTLRIDGGNYDGEDVILNYAGLQPKTIFRLYDILVAAGIIDTYYDAELKKWKAFPTKEELEGKTLRIQVENEPFVSKKDGQTQYNEDGSIKMLDSARPTRFAKRGDTEFTFRPTIKAKPAAGAPAAPGGVPSVPSVPGAPKNGSDTTPW